MVNGRGKLITVGFVALGCPKNVVDSERMLAQIAQAGFTITSDADTADVVVVNTCGFIAPAKNEALRAIRHALRCKRRGQVRKVIVAGCLSERLGEVLFDQVNGIDAIVGLGQRDEIAGIIRQTFDASGERTFLDYMPITVADDRTRLRIGPAHWAYLRISEGCDHKCSFCTVPQIRGRFRSKPLSLVIAEARELVRSGAVELNLIGQDTSCYGWDLGERDGLAKLITELGKINGLEWIRLLYVNPFGISDVLVEAIATNKKVVHYIDMPIQHIDDEILWRMSRPDAEDCIKELIGKLRSAIADIVLRTTLIVGFPGETERQFDSLVNFVRWARFDALGCFKYYRERGTAAAQMLGQVPDRVKRQRLRELMVAQQQVAFEKNAARVGSRLRCLIDFVSGAGGDRGRFYGQAPDIDGVCIVKGCLAKPGTFVNTRVVQARNYDLVVEGI